VDTDYAALQAWLDEYKGEGLDGNPHPTWLNYRKEGERLFLWSWIVAQKPVSSLTRADLMEFEVFLQDPPAHWVADHAYHRGDGRWRPFVRRKKRVRRVKGKPEPKPEYRAGLMLPSVVQARRILRGLFEYLRLEGYLAHNPLDRPKRTRRRSGAGDKGSAASRDARRLSEAAWELALKTNDRAIEMAAEGSSEHARLVRQRWIVLFLYHSGARRVEAALATMGDIRQRSVPEANGKKRTSWWWDVTGKGGKEGTVPMPAGAMAALKAYRRSLGLPALPSPDEETPLIDRLPKADGQPRKGGQMSAAMIAGEVKAFFRRAAEAAFESNDPEDRDLEPLLSRASTHWIRHTYGTHQVESNIPLHHAQRNLRHAKLDTTGQYLHPDDGERAKTIKKFR